jgi:hypothetical protein
MNAPLRTASDDLPAAVMQDSHHPTCSFSAF